MRSITAGEKSSGNKELRFPASSTPQLKRGTQLKSRAEAGKGLHNFICCQFPTRIIR